MTVAEPVVREAVESDFERIAEITNAWIAKDAAHFALGAMPLAEYVSSWRRDERRHPWFVATDGGVVIGYAKSYDWKTRGAYRWTCEIGVYVDAERRRSGVGRALYRALFAELERRGFRTALAGITLPNAASVALHESFGMKHVGTMPAVGYKLGSWRSVGYWASPIGAGATTAPARDAPPPFSRG